MAADLPQFLCYYWDTSSDRYESIVQHSIGHHMQHALKLKKLILQQATDKIVYQSVHFPIQLSEMKRKMEEGLQFNINLETQELTWLNIQGSSSKRSGEDQSPRKRNHSEMQGDVTTATPSTTEAPSTESESDEGITRIFSRVLAMMKDIGRQKDFISVLRGLADGELDPKNISLHLLLDIGGFLSAHTTNNVRYNQTTRAFWSVVRKLFRGKATHFFRGHMASDPDSEHDVVNTAEYRINFAIPSDKSLAKHTQKYKVGAEKPGILRYPLDSFANAYGPSDVKISIDGKKIAYGFGKQLGDEDLCGHEDPPTLQDCQQRIRAEENLLEEMYDRIAELAIEEKELKDMTEEDSQKLKQEMLQVITILSERVREQRTVIMKKKSFLQTKIIQCQSCCHSLLESIDEFGYVIAHINGTGASYIKGFNTKVFLDHQANYSCLLNFPDEVYDNIDPDSEINKVKQRTSAWHNIRKKACVTGSTWYNAIGLRSLKDMKLHYDRLFNRKTQVVPDELQKLFDHGMENEINGVATIVGKVIPVYFPELVFREDGCERINLADSQRFVIISGDGSGVDAEGNTKMAFE